MIALRLIALLFISLPAFAEYGSAVMSEVTSVYDADTFRANISGWPPIIGQRAPIRVKGVDAPELRGKYFRILAVVYVDDENLGQALINAGLARPYDGGTRRGMVRSMSFAGS